MNLSGINQIHLPIIEGTAPLTRCQKKVVAVALASIAFFALQFSLSLMMTFTLTGVICILTYFSEKHLRNHLPGNDWTNTEFSGKKNLIFYLKLILLKPFLMVLFARIFNLGVPGIPQQGLALKILLNPFKMIPLVGIIAPIAEEILFRGFFLERLEDGFELMHRYTSLRFSPTFTDITTQTIQAVVFGAFHIKKGMDAFVQQILMMQLTLFGVATSHLKKTYQTLLVPIGLHAANNISALVYIFLRARFS